MHLIDISFLIIYLKEEEMKRVVFISLLLVIAMLACEKEEYVPTYIGVGSIEMNGESDIDFIVNLDNGDTLTAIEVFDDNTIAEGDRVLVEYSVIEEKSTNSYDVSIYDIDDILTKGVIQLTEDNNDSIGDDAIHTNDNNIWIFGKHLTIIFDYYGYGQTHSINLARPIGEPIYDDDGRLILEFRHNANGDFPYNSIRGIVSFELESLRIGDEESIDFVIRINNYDDEDFEFVGSYTFESTNESTILKFQKRNLLNLSNSSIN